MVVLQSYLKITWLVIFIEDESYIGRVFCFGMILII